MPYYIINTLSRTMKANTMKTRLNRLSAVLIASTLSLAAAQTMAQAPAAKQSMKKQGKGDKLQTKEELRACIQLKESNNARINELDKKAEENRKEKQALMNAPKDTSGSDVKADVEAKLAVFKAAEGAFADNNTALKAWDSRMEEFEQRAKIMANADRARKKMFEERDALKAKESGLVADRDAKYKVYVAAVESANATISKLGNANADWNKKNAALVAEQEQLQASRDKWLAECGNRRFIDDDEKEIKAGK
jgi:hypothetical protein